MNKNILMMVIGISIGAISICFIKNDKGVKQQTKYIQLKEDFSLVNGSLLKKGTLLKVDYSASEGFTRYILFINYTSGSGIEPMTFDKINLVKPYWMYRIDSLQ